MTDHARPHYAEIRGRRDLLLVLALVAVAAAAELVISPLQRLTLVIVRYEDLFVAELLIILLSATVGLVFYAFRRLGDARRFRDESAALRTSVNQAEGLHRRYRTYAEAVVHGQEEERMRLARDLHDDSIHRLILLGQKLELARFDHAPSPAEADLAAIQDMVNETISGMRRFIQELRPTFLDELGLVPAIEALVEEKSERTGVDISFEVTGTKVRLTESEEVTLFRIAQSALRNVVLHSGSESAEVRLDFTGSAVHLEIEDFGRGFDVDDHTGGENGESASYGLLGMRERAELQGGTFELVSSVGTGTVIRVDLPTEVQTTERDKARV